MGSCGSVELPSIDSKAHVFFLGQEKGHEPRGRRRVSFGPRRCGLGVWFCLHWHLLAAHYHAWRLGEAKNLEEANPWLEALARDSEKPNVCEAILQKLGEDREQLTFWFFASISWQPESMLPLLQGFSDHLHRDERPLSLWARFLLWHAAGGKNFQAAVTKSHEGVLGTSAVKGLAQGVPATGVQIHDPCPFGGSVLEAQRALDRKDGAGSAPDSACRTAHVPAKAGDDHASCAV